MVLMYRHAVLSMLLILNPLAAFYTISELQHFKSNLVEIFYTDKIRDDKSIDLLRNLLNGNKK